ncbi:hypothetical protein [Paraburkholderia sp. BCC1885]|uniref:hypothetical protein n=1 Tax=Paraburkholderia sp. BCC1885 TaxID=2562669 RepID=UPI0016432330|nr:hypothetical protein [Paraburkholderia sp. BCC1885]
MQRDDGLGSHRAREACDDDPVRIERFAEPGCNVSGKSHSVACNTCNTWPLGFGMSPKN